MISKIVTHMHLIQRFLIVFITVVVLTACGSKDSPSIPTITSDPTRTDIIEAVRDSVNGKTYTATIFRDEAVFHTCSQMDVDMDPYMPHNPELAKCPSVGATYTTWETYTEYETRTCEALPGPEYGWYVEELGDDKWRVTYSGSVWDVEKLEGGAASMGDTVHVSGFVFKITAYQDC